MFPFITHLLSDKHLLGFFHYFLTVLKFSKFFSLCDAYKNFTEITFCCAGSINLTFYGDTALSTVESQIMTLQHSKNAE